MPYHLLLRLADMSRPKHLQILTDSPKKIASANQETLSATSVPMEKDIAIPEDVSPGDPSVRKSLVLLKKRTRKLATSTKSSGDDEVINETVESSDALAHSFSNGLSSCPTCQRTFNPESFEKHMRVCKKVFVQKRKTFDSQKKRLLANDETSSLVSLEPSKRPIDSASNASEKPTVDHVVPKWKADSEAFRQAMRAIKTGAEVVSKPDPSLIECPHCNRRFSSQAAERHIPLCNSIKSKPTSLRKGSGLGGGNQGRKS